MAGTLDNFSAFSRALAFSGTRANTGGQSAIPYVMECRMKKEVRKITTSDLAELTRLKYRRYNMQRKVTTALLLERIQELPVKRLAYCLGVFNEAGLLEACKKILRIKK